MRSRTLLTIGVAMIASFAVAEDGYRHGRLRFAEPGVSLQRATEVSTEEAAVNTPFLPGDRVFTDAAGRAEFQFPDGTVVRLDARSKLDYSGHEEGAEERIVLRLWSGSAIARVRGVSSARFEIETPAGTVEVRGRAVVRADVEAGELRLSVASGEAVLDDGRERTRLAAGERTFARWGAPAEEPRRFDFSERDDFARWDDQREAEDGWAVRSSEYLPDELDPYAGEFERNGSWQYEASAGYVWVPRVAVGWQPYWNGRWAWTPYGWTWIAYDPWGWAPFHYGRWGLSVSFGWYWIPGRTWGPGWVSWAVGGGHVGWCPLGYDDRPVFGFGFGGVAYYRGGRFDGHDRWRGWSLVPRQHFESRQAVRRGFIDPQSLPQSVTASFVTQRVPPLGGGRASYAIPRALGPAGSGPGTTYRRGSPGDGGGPPEGAVPPGHAVPRGGGSGATPPSPSPYDRARPYMGRGGGTAAGSRGKSSPTEGPATGDVPATAVPRGGRHVPGSDGRLGAGTPPPHTRTGDRSRGPGDAPADPGTAGAPRAPGGRTLPSPPPSGQSAPPSRRPEGQAVPRTVAPKQGGGAKYR